MKKLLIYLTSFVIVLLFARDLDAADAPRRAVALISIDGMHPSYVLQADRYGLRIPNLRRMLKDGVHAQGVTGVLPTVTYPTHTTMLTGVSPSKHGIYSNQVFDPTRVNEGGWYWYAEDIKVPTLWEAASRAGYVVGSISWPVSIGARGVQFNIPEFWRAQTSEDLKLLRAISTPGLLADLGKTAGEYTTDLDAVERGDWYRTRYAIAMIREKRVRFLTLHLAALDHVEHASGPYSRQALDSLEEIDRMVGELEAAMRAADPRAAMCIVSDHGFGAATGELNLAAAFVQAGLITPNPKPGKPGILDWKAQPWAASGSAAILLKDPKDEGVRKQVAELLQRLASDPKNGINRVLDAKAIAELGGAPVAAFWIDMKTNHAIASALTGPVTREIPLRGTHGYAPVHPELETSFFMSAPDARTGADLGRIEMRHIAPTVAALLGLEFPTAELKALPVVESVASKNR